MLDKFIPYKSFIMVLSPKAAERIRTPSLPEGFAFRCFQEGDERNWRRIETSVLEFADEEKAETYFRARFLRYPDELKKRCLFVVDPGGQAVATATAWCETPEFPDACRPQLTWVAVEPEFQRRGIGRAIVSKAISLYEDLRPGQKIFLHTQTWSHRAIRLYRSLGFTLCREQRICRCGLAPQLYDNEYAEGITVLRQVMDAEKIDELIETSVD